SARLLPAIAWFPLVTLTRPSRLPHTRPRGRSVCPPVPSLTGSSRGPLSLWTEFYHDDTSYQDYQTPASLLTCPQRPASSGSGPPQGLQAAQRPGQGQERSPPTEGGRPSRGPARATFSRGRHRCRFPLPLG